MSFADWIERHAVECEEHAFDRIVTVTTAARWTINATTAVRDVTTVTDTGIAAGREAVVDEPVGAGPSRRRIASTAYILRADRLSATPRQGETTITDGSEVWPVVAVTEHGGGLLRLAVRTNG